MCIGYWTRSSKLLCCVFCSHWIPRLIQKLFFFSRKKLREIIFWQSGFFYRKKAVKAPAELDFFRCYGLRHERFYDTWQSWMYHTQKSKNGNTRRFSPSVNWGWEWGRGIILFICVVCREGSICCSRKKFGVGPAFSMDLLIEKKNLNEGDYWWFMKVFCRHWWRLVLYEDKLIFNLPLATRFVQGASYF